MKTIIGKELRENLKLALPAFLLVAGLVIFAAWDGGNVLAEGSFLAITSLPLRSLWRSSWLAADSPRTPRDLWAFLVHRPLRAPRFFFAKIGAGLLLYAAATSLPMLGYIIWLRIPGNDGTPFEWAMTRPILGCFLLGIVWYFGRDADQPPPARLVCQPRPWSRRGLSASRVRVFVSRPAVVLAL